MVTHFSKLNEKEIDLMYDAIPLITLLIAHADGEMDEDERAWSEKITQVRTYSYHPSMQGYYEKIREKYQENLNQLMNSLPKDNDQRLAEISRRLSGLNDILPKLDPVFAWRFYHGMLTFAQHVAKASGGILGWGAISKEEKKYLGLDMINPIVLEEEPED